MEEIPNVLQALTVLTYTYCCVFLSQTELVLVLVCSCSIRVYVPGAHVCCFAFFYGKIKLVLNHTPSVHKLTPISEWKKNTQKSIDNQIRRILPFWQHIFLVGTLGWVLTDCMPL